jgi:hypothetical protein
MGSTMKTESCSRPAPPRRHPDEPRDDPPDTPEANPGDEEARAKVPIVPPADLVVSIVNHQDPIIGGSNVVLTAADESGMQGAVPIGGAVRDSLVRYTITVRNDGPADAEDVVVTHMLPVGLSLLSDIGVRSLGTLRAGASVRYTIAAQTAPGVLGALTAQINARTASPEANPLDDPAP